jgi:hypothetical protein
MQLALRLDEVQGRRGEPHVGHFFTSSLIEIDFD